MDSAGQFSIWQGIILFLLLLTAAVLASRRSKRSGFLQNSHSLPTLVVGQVFSAGFLGLSSSPT